MGFSFNWTESKEDNHKFKEAVGFGREEGSWSKDLEDLDGRKGVGRKFASRCKRYCNF